MKKQFFIGLAVLAGSFIACNEDDDPKYTPVDRMAGEWKLTKIGALNSTNNLNYTNVSSDCASTLVFADSTFTENAAELVDGACQTTARTGTYRIDNGNLVRTVSGADDTTDILTLTDTELELVHSDDETSALSFMRYRKQTPVQIEE